jgi:hypothetical protein
MGGTIEEIALKLKIKLHQHSYQLKGKWREHDSEFHHNTKYLYITLIVATAIHTEKSWE